MKEVGNFVKYGQEKGYIEISLKTKEEDHNPHYLVIKRVLKRTSNASDWYLDGEKKTQKQIQEVTDSLGIQLDNLCQFLAQERVSEFAKLDGVSLLRETLKAATPKETLQLLDEAIEAKRKEKLSKQVFLPLFVANFYF